MVKRLFLIFVSFGFIAVQGFVPAPGWEAEVACLKREHGTLGTATCCGKYSYLVGVDYIDFWKDCAAPKAKEPLDQTMWRIYTCIIEKALKGSALTLPNFAQIMTKNFPEERKKQIVDKVAKEKVDLAGASTNTDKLRIIREAYYNIEIIFASCLPAVETNDCYSPQEVVIPVSNGTCAATLEESHRRGTCCLNKTMPISVLVPFAPEADVLKQWKILLETVSRNHPLVHAVDVQKACVVTSDLLALGKIMKADVLKPPDAMKVVEMLMPQFLATEEIKALKDSVVAVMKKAQTSDGDPLIKAYITKAESYYRGTLKDELVDIKNETNAEALFVTCLIHKTISGYITNYFYKKCMGE